MEILLGFGIAVAIGITGVGGGVITAPALILLMGMPPVEAVTVSLIFAAVVKTLIAPQYLWRGQVDFRVLAKLLAGGLPGVVAGSIILQRLSASERHGTMYGILGGTISVMACIHLYRLTKGLPVHATRDRSNWLPLIALPIGAEVGFSSAGSGALGTLALMGCTKLTTAQVVATDVFFGLVLSIVGGGLHWSAAGHTVPPILWKLLAGGVAGAFAGTYAATSIPARPLRAALCVWLIFIGAQLCWRAF
jgi:uncharacterized membrane protein YfcA